MFYGGMSADFTYNNWFGNTIDVDVDQASPVSGDFGKGWFQKGTADGRRHHGGEPRRRPASRTATARTTTTCAGPHPLSDRSFEWPFRVRLKEISEPPKERASFSFHIADLLEHVRIVGRRRRQQVDADDQCASLGRETP